jgi:hypothetical protein
MYKFLLFFVALSFLNCNNAAIKNSSAQSAQLKVNAHTKCHVALISVADLDGDNSAWWNEWHKIKKAKSYKETPCEFNYLIQGDYVLVVYNPASMDFDPNNGKPEEAADGVVLELVTIGKNSDVSYDFGIKDFVEWNCLSCPWLYAFDGTEYVKLTEVIQDIVGEENCQTTTHTISSNFVLNGKLNIRIQEEKEETSYLDRVNLTIDGKKTIPNRKELCTEDKDFLQLEKGEFVELEFEVGKLTANTNIVLECNGFYVPKKKFLEAVYKKYLYKNN